MVSSGTGTSEQIIHCAQVDQPSWPFLRRELAPPPVLTPAAVRTELVCTWCRRFDGSCRTAFYSGPLGRAWECADEARQGRARRAISRHDCKSMAPRCRIRIKAGPLFGVFARTRHGLTRRIRLWHFRALSVAEFEIWRTGRGHVRGEVGRAINSRAQHRVRSLHLATARILHCARPPGRAQARRPLACTALALARARIRECASMRHAYARARARANTGPRAVRAARAFTLVPCAACASATRSRARAQPAPRDEPARAPPTCAP